MTTTPNPYAFHVRPGMRQGLRTELPLPTRLVSNEEFPPLPQTPEQRRVVFGRFFDVLPVEAAEPSAFQEPKGGAWRS
jgi:hypothetical protein